MLFEILKLFGCWVGDVADNLAVACAPGDYFAADALVLVCSAWEESADCG